MADQNVFDGSVKDYTFPLPSADYSQSPISVQAPYLVDASGVDGRVKGGIRSFPGFRSLRISEAYPTSFAGSGNSEPNGPLLVGPGINHTDDGTTVSYKFLELQFKREAAARKDRVKFFKAVSFFKDWQESALVSGFIMVIPYYGPWANDNNPGLPYEPDAETFGTASECDVAVFVYWDDAQYVIDDYITTAQDRYLPGGWRARIISRPRYYNDTSETWDGLSDTCFLNVSDMDVSSEGRYCYIVNPTLMSGITDDVAQYWGSSDHITTVVHPTYGTERGESDSVTGPCVLYWDDESSFVRVRPFANKLDYPVLGRDPIYDDVVDVVDGNDIMHATESVPVVYAPGDGAGGPPDEDDGEYGWLFDEGGDPDPDRNYIKFGITLYSTKFDIRTPMVEWDTTFNTHDEEDLWRYAVVVLGVHADAWSQEYDKVEVWRSPRSDTTSGTTLLYREQYLDLPETMPTYSVYHDKALALGDDPDFPTSTTDDQYRNYLVFFGHTNAERIFNNLPDATNMPDTGLGIGSSEYKDVLQQRMWARWDLYADGVGEYPDYDLAVHSAVTFAENTDGSSDVLLLARTIYNALWDFTGDIDENTSKFRVMNQVGFAVTSRGSRQIEDPYGVSDGVCPREPFVSPRLRWTSLAIPSPENFSAVENRWYPDRPVGMVWGVEVLGDTTFVMGTIELMALKRIGARLASKPVGRGIVPVNRCCWCKAGSILFVLTRDGLVGVDAGASAVRPVTQLNNILLSDAEWGRELVQQTDGDWPPIGMVYDAVGDCLFIWNRERKEALCFWLKTGNVTRLQDFVWEMGTRGNVRNGILVFSPYESPPTGRENTQFVKYPPLDRAFFVCERCLGHSTSQTTAKFVSYDIFYADFDPQPEPEVWWFRNEALAREINGSWTMHGNPGLVHYDYAGDDGDMAKRVLTGIGENARAGSIYDVGGMPSFDVPLIDPPGNASELEDYTEDTYRFVKRMRGSVVHLFSADGTAHYRRLLYDIVIPSVVGEDYDYMSYMLYPSLTSEEVTALGTGFKYAVAPVVMRVVTPSLGQTGRRTVITSGKSEFDVMSVRYFYPDWSDKVNYPTPFFTGEDDGSNLMAFLIGYNQQDGELSTYSTYGPDHTTTGDTEMAAFTRHMCSPGRLTLKGKGKMRATRKPGDAAAKCAFGGESVVMGVEMYPTGCLVELRGLQVHGSILPAQRRS